MNDSFALFLVCTERASSKACAHIGSAICFLMFILYLLCLRACVHTIYSYHDILMSFVWGEIVVV